MATPFNPPRLEVLREENKFHSKTSPPSMFGLVKQPSSPLTPTECAGSYESATISPNSHQSITPSSTRGAGGGSRNKPSHHHHHHNHNHRNDVVSPTSTDALPSQVKVSPTNTNLTASSSHQQKTTPTNGGGGGSGGKAAAMVAPPSPKEMEFCQILLNGILRKVGSVAVVILKAFIESSEHLELYKEVLAPYQLSLHSFFERHADDFYLWNYSVAEIEKYDLAPYFKTDETRVASRRAVEKGPTGVSKQMVFEADGLAAKQMREEEESILRALLQTLEARSPDFQLQRKDALESLRAAFPKSKGPGGILSSSNSFHRFLSRHPQVVGSVGANIVLGPVSKTSAPVQTPPISPALMACVIDTGNGGGGNTTTAAMKSVGTPPVAPVLSSPLQGPTTTGTWQEKAAFEMFLLTK
eukprot:PhF_6_TR36042/c4_g1_i1/m.52270